MFVYAITHVQTGRKYIGKSYDPKKRWREHRRDALRPRHKSSLIHRAMHAYGLDAFKFEVLGRYASDEEALRAEAFWVARLRTNVRGIGFNLTNGGRGGMAGIPKSPEHRARIAAAHRGRKHSAAHIAAMRLVPQTPEKGARISAALRGRKRRPLSGLVREKLAIVNLGRRHSPETKAKLSALKLGKRASEETRAKLSRLRLGRKRAPFSPTAMANLKAAGLARRGRTLTEEHRAKLRAVRKSTEERTRLSAAQKASEASRAHVAAMSAANVGRKHSPETKAKMAAAQRGKTRSAEHCSNLSKAKRGKPGRPWTDEQRAKVAAYWSRVKEARCETKSGAPL